MKRYLPHLLIISTLCFQSTAVGALKSENPFHERLFLAQAEDLNKSPDTTEQEFDDFEDENWDDFDDEFGEDGTDALVISDPLEPINRGIFWFNDKLYFYALKPVAKAYRVIPEPVRVSVSNFAHHWTSPIRFLNALMQAKLNDAGTELGRFFINSTLGVLGLFDPAKEHGGLRRTDEDFGQTLGAYGVKPGIYLVLPFVGPSNLRDGTGDIVDAMVNPLSRELNSSEYLTYQGVEVINTLSLDKDTYEAIKRDALDPYLFIRDAYMQNREAKVKK